MVILIQSKMKDKMESLNCQQKRTNGCEVLLVFKNDSCILATLKNARSTDKRNALKRTR